MTAEKKKILLVDDDKFLLDMYAMKFSAQNFEVHACLSVNDALKALRGGFDPDAVLFDLVMPENDGFSLLLALSKEKLAGSAVLVALTNETNDAAKQKAEELGADHLIEKASMIPTEVVNTVEKLLAQGKGG